MIPPMYGNQGLPEKCDSWDQLLKYRKLDSIYYQNREESVLEMVQ
eukprot:SAG11_NODE_1885_length_4119_cov_7.094527_4_plen_45_part_00